MDKGASACDAELEKWRGPINFSLDMAFLGIYISNKDDPGAEECRIRIAP